ncbi:hypothetical protein Pmani_009795 [Petrolisthes manimaculis]|uniref:Guanine deaminase n=1 Tax=Petrolisthes manimaculis TaxID=1843537 RepID=A0AAE1Q6A5_9EUCA|nr:hypothetical protein Pmani_009795 [Petrolisthes manimaculis]
MDTNGTTEPGLKENRTSVNGTHCGFKVLVGTLVHSTREDPMVILTDKALGVLHSKIKFVAEADQLEELQTQYGFPDSAVTRLSNRQFVMPGLIDTHIHASQFPNNGLKMDLPLLEWLQKYTFPTEATFADVKFASHVYPRVVDRTLRNGTTTASYFATAHLEATKILANAVATRGQRALVGKVNMLHNCPPNYREDSVEQSIQETEQFITYVNNMKNPLVSAIVTPRFAPTCTDDQLTELGQLAAQHSTHIQTHMSETRPEVAWVKELFPHRTNYCDVYHQAGLLTRKTILAHCIWLSEEELELMSRMEVGVSHCPSSNLNLISGLCDVRKLLHHGIKVSLGTDCSGGNSASILDSLRRALHVSRCLTIHDSDQHPDPLTLREAFRLATLGGAQVVDMEDRIGNLEVGKEFDALVIDTQATGSPLDIFDKDKEPDLVEKFLYNGDDRNIVQVFVAGRCVVQNSE